MNNKVIKSIVFTILALVLLPINAVAQEQQLSHEISSDLYLYASTALNKDDINEADLEEITTIKSQYYDHEGTRHTIYDYTGVEKFKNIETFHLVINEDLNASDYDLTSFSNSDEELMIIFDHNYSDNLSIDETNEVYSRWENETFASHQVSTLAELLLQINNPDKRISVEVNSLVYVKNYGKLVQNYNFHLSQFIVSPTFSSVIRSENHQAHKLSFDENLQEDIYGFTIENDYLFPVGPLGSNNTMVIDNNKTQGYTYLEARTLNDTDKQMVRDNHLKITFTRTDGQQEVGDIERLLTSKTTSVFGARSVDIEMNQTLMNYFLMRELEASSQGQQFRPFEVWFSSGFASTRGLGRSEVLTQERIALNIIQPLGYTFTVKFDSKNGLDTIPNQELNFGAKVIQPEDPTLDKHSFTTWVKEDGEAWDFENDRVTEDLTLYATYTVNPIVETFRVSFNSNGGSSITPYEGVLLNEKISEPNSPTKEGYTFVGWYQDNETFKKVWNFDLNTVSQDLTLYAKWEEVKKPVDPEKPSPEKPTPPKEPGDSKDVENTKTPPTGLYNQVILYSNVVVLMMLLIIILRSKKTNIIEK